MIIIRGEYSSIFCDKYRGKYFPFGEDFELMKKKLKKKMTINKHEK